MGWTLIQEIGPQTIRVENADKKLIEYLAKQDGLSKKEIELLFNYKEYHREATVWRIET